ncbi:hypothetical protein Ptr86124_005023 [Pyrenophora tritici-repentis]|uniref:Uncharacterized protein n=2 Tax=Pyrenophora tritici-repentis TaxID=45151 RepID=A0A922NIE5_9PLEO|nr:hypothetical protein Ptr86124_005023 [Pyrenophora tritici-repentis]
MQQVVNLCGRNIVLESLPPGVDFRETSIPMDGGPPQVTYEGNGLPGNSISLRECRREARAKSKSIVDNYKLLNNVLARYEDLIRTRWSKKTRTQRKTILHNSWHTTIPTSHRADLIAFRRSELDVGGEERNEDSAYWWPHINEEDLLTPATIPRFLNSRGRNAPSVFVDMDWDRSRSLRLDTKDDENDDEEIKEEEEEDNKDDDKDVEYLMNLRSADLTEYGKLVKVPAGAEDEGIKISATRGLLILEIQKAVMEFLINVCQGILHEKDLDPTALQQTVDLERIQSPIHARLREREDYAWAMREDPSFFAVVVNDWSEHSSDQIPPDGKKISPNLSHPIRIRQHWDRTVSSAINEVYGYLVIWKLMSDKLDAIIELQKQQAKGNYGRPEDVPGLVDAVRILKVILDVRVVEKQQRELGFILLSSPPMRPLFITDGGPVSGRNLAPPATLVMEMLRVIQQDKTQKPRITPMVARFMSDLGLGYELRSRLSILCPQIFQPGKKEEARTKVALDSLKFDQAFLAMYDLKMIVSPFYAGKNFLRLGDLGEPFTLPYPVSKRRTKESVETMQASERRLDALWEKYDEHLKKLLKPEVEAFLQKSMPARGELQRTTDWVEPEKPAKKARQNEEYITPVIPEPNPDPSTTLPIRKEKPKTCGTPAPSPTEPASSISHSQTTAPSTPVFTVPKKPYHTFSNVFFQPSTSSHPGEIL